MNHRTVINPANMSKLPFRHTTVNGIVYPFSVKMDKLENFPLHSNDLFIDTYPKSGTTWMQHITKLIHNNGIDDGSNIDKASTWLEYEIPRRPEHINAVSSTPRVFKSHASYSVMPSGPPSISPAKYIYVARNPKDVAVSYYHHMRLFKAFEFTGTWDDFFQLFMDGKVFYGLWFDHVLEWWGHRHEPNVLFLKYEDMKEDLSGAVRSVINFIGYDHLKPVVIDEIVKQTTFESMRSNASVSYSWESQNPHEAPFIRKGTVGDWRNYFTVEQSAKLDAVYTQKMKDSGLDFDFGKLL